MQTVQSEEDAVSYFVELYSSDGSELQCVCGNKLFWQEIRLRKTKCGRCRRDFWVTAGTLFEHVHKLRPYLIALHLRLNKMDIIPGELAALAGVATSTAWEILKRISMVAVRQMTADFQEFSSLSFLAIYKRRSKATPKYSHPRLEEEEFEIQQAPSQLAAVEEERPALSEQDEIVYNAILMEEVTFDRLLDITQLSIADLSLSLLHLQVEARLIDRPFCEQYRRRAAPVNGQSASSKGQFDEIEPFTNYVNRLHGGISRKYAQLYAANYWYATQQEQWRIGALLSACLKSKPITRKDILKYVSPAYIKLLPVKRLVTA